MVGADVMAGMRVAGAVRVRVPLRRPMVTAHGAWTVCDSWLIRLVDELGRPGIGEATLGPFAAPTDQVALDGHVRALVAEGVPAPPGVGGGEPDPAEAALRSAIEGAHFDLGRVAGLPGRPHETIAVNALIGAESIPAAIAAAREAVAAGFRTLKLKGGGERSSAQLVERLAAIREAVGPDVALRLDVNGTWAAGVATERLSALAAAGLELEYVEQPMPVGPIEETAVGLAALRAVTAGAVPIAADESVTSSAAARILLAAGAVDALVVKPGRVGGPAVALAIAGAANRAGVTVTISTLLETGVGLLTAMAVAAAAGMPGVAHGLSTGGLLAADLVGGRSVVTGGRARSSLGANTTLGLAGRLEAVAVARYAVEHVGAWA